MIGQIRDMLPILWAQGRCELAKEIMGGIHQDNFSGVDYSEIMRIFHALKFALAEWEDES